ncbi:MAG TPA: HAMP domain-containing protein, partial [Alphaproteobacteria bacterium]|nr:HAMP domain-containing protein [Alphaproteobacteria bacterium]
YKRLITQLGMAIICLAALFGSNFYISRRIVTPLEAAKKTIDAIVDERFDIVIPDTTSNDEVGQILHTTRKLHQESIISLQIKASIESVDACLMIADVKGNLTYINPALKTLFKKYGSEISSKVTFMENSSTIETLRPFLDSKNISTTAAFKTNCKIGSCDFNLNFYPVFNKHRHYLGTVIVWTDLPQELKVQNEVKTLLTNAINGDLSYRIPLDGKEGFMETLCIDMNQLLGVTERTLNAIQSSSEKVFGVIEMINDISFKQTCWRLMPL